MRIPGLCCCRNFEKADIRREQIFIKINTSDPKTYNYMDSVDNGFSGLQQSKRF
jgi:hypothetical protein